MPMPAVPKNIQLDSVSMNYQEATTSFVITRFKNRIGEKDLRYSVGMGLTSANEKQTRKSLSFLGKYKSITTKIVLA